MLTTALNTKGYMGGSPFDKDGLDTYQLFGWTEKSKLVRLNFLRVDGDATQIKMELYDRPFGQDATLLYSEVLHFRTLKVYEPAVELLGCRLGRLYVRLTALDGTKQNHCQAAFFGEAII